MKRKLLPLALLLLPLALFPLALQAQPNAVISSPRAGAVLSGRVDIRGTAVHGNFQFYKIEYTGPACADYQCLIPPFADVQRQQVQDGVLDVWDTRMVPDGTYSLRLRVVDNTGNWNEHFVENLVVQNAAPPTATPSPAATESPTPSPTPTVTSTPGAATPTITVGQALTPVGTPSPTPLPLLTPGASGSGSASGGGEAGTPQAAGASLIPRISLNPRPALRLLAQGALGGLALMLAGGLIVLIRTWVLR